MYAKLNNGAVSQYPYTAQDLGNDNPNVSFPAHLDDETLARFDVVRVIVTSAPDYDQNTHATEPNGCAYIAERKRWETQWTIRSKTPDELAAAREQKAESVRTERNQKLTATDWTQLSDAPVDKTSWANYRQALRDITNQAGFPFDVIWPQAPI